MERAIARWARRQHGLITRDQALDAGLSSSALSRRVATGAWRRVAAGVFALVSSPATWRQRLLAACLAAGPFAVASHRSAAALFGLSGIPPGAVEIAVPRGRSHRSDLAVVHQVRDLPAGDVTRIDGIPVTRPARTLVDLAAVVSPRALEEAVDDALCRRLVTLSRLDRRAEALAQRGRAGAANLRAILATWHDGGLLPQETAEARLFRRLVHSGLPPPERQHEVWSDGRLLGRLDLAWPDARVGFELDGFRWHGTPRAHRRDIARHNGLKARGWTVFQATPADLVDDAAHLGALVAPLLDPTAADPPVEVRRPA
ncbi:MAG: type IV toxin-antitoxin system AbiEi family antitoxin domain-containing protein [Actinobacteria bacterium]|nr:type IV toxin-antitoxin system AbiEi family antitoxin domain-containing protein [Actinomycetota bacterium]